MCIDPSFHTTLARPDEFQNNLVAMIIAKSKY